MYFTAFYGEVRYLVCGGPVPSQPLLDIPNDRIRRAQGYLYKVGCKLVHRNRREVIRMPICHPEPL